MGLLADADAVLLILRAGVPAGRACGFPEVSDAILLVRGALVVGEVGVGLLADADAVLHILRAGVPAGRAGGFPEVGDASVLVRGALVADKRDVGSIIDPDPVGAVVPDPAAFHTTCR